MPTRYFISIYRDYNGTHPQLYCQDNHFVNKSLYQLPLTYFSAPAANTDADLWKWVKALEILLYKFSYTVRSLRQYQSVAALSLVELAHDWQSSWLDLLNGADDPATLAATREYLNIIPTKDPTQIELRIITNSESLKKQLRPTFKYTYLHESTDTELPLTVKHSADLLANKKIIITNNLLTLLQAEAGATAEALAYYQLVDYYYSKFVKRSPGQKFVFG